MPNTFALCVGSIIIWIVLGRLIIAILFRDILIKIGLEQKAAELAKGKWIPSFWHPAFWGSWLIFACLLWPITTLMAWRFLKDLDKNPEKVGKLHSDIQKMIQEITEVENG